MDATTTGSENFEAILPMSRKLRLDAGDVFTELRLLVEQTGASVRIDPRSAAVAIQPNSGLLNFRKPQAETLFFELDGVRLRVAVEDRPYGDRRGLHAYINPALWAKGLGELTDHRAHVRIYEAGIEGEEGPDAVFDRAAAVTATASVLAKLCGPQAVIWMPARNAVPMTLFERQMAELAAGRAPLELWIRWHLIPPGEKQEAMPGVMTEGLSPFTGREITTQPSHVSPRIMVNHVYGVARHLVDEGGTIKGGEIFRTPETGALRVRLTSRNSRTRRPFFELAAQPQAAE